MASIREYHRPVRIEDALALVGRDGVVTVLVGGGTVVVADDGTAPVEVVDLQALGLDEQVAVDGRLRFGATTRLQDIVDADAAPSLLRDAAEREAPNTIRNAATIGGTVAVGDPESGLVAALLVHDAVVEVISPAGTSEVGLADLLADRTPLNGSIITAVVVETAGESSWAGTGRTPADTPIVAAYARHHGGVTRLALTGVAGSPVLVAPDEVAALDPPADFRGSAEYRKVLAGVLAARALGALEVPA